MIMLDAQRNKYIETTVQTASPAKLLLLLYDGAIRFCRQGIESIKQHNYEDANKYLCRTQDIIREFQLSMRKDAFVAESLQLLYDYFIDKLRESNVKKTVEPAEEVLQYLIELKETWSQASKQTLQSAVGAPNA